MAVPGLVDVRNFIARFDSRRARGPNRREAVSLGSRQIYILPTRHGLSFAGLIAVLLLIAINYDNEMVYMLSFLLASLGVMTFLHTQRNLLGLKVSATGCDPVFAGEQALFHICIHNSAQDRIGVRIENDASNIPVFDVAGNDTRCVAFPVVAARRGWIECPAFELATHYPLGVAYAWSTRLRLAARCLAYPMPAERSQLPEKLRSENDGSLSSIRDGDDFVGLRPFREGDSMARINWKAVARGQGWITKEFGAPVAETLWIRWQDFAPADTEERLSLMTRALLDADEAGREYGLQLPGQRLDVGGGAEHRRRCLEALALHESS